MIPHSSAGAQSWGHPLRTFDNGPGRADASQVSNSPDSRYPTPILPSHGGQPAVIDLTSGAGDPEERAPPAKRLKLDVSAGNFNDASPAPATSAEPRNTPGVANSKSFALSWRGRPVWSFQSLVSEASSGGEAAEEDAVSTPQGRMPPSFPHLPWKCAPPEQSSDDAAKLQDPPSVKKVETTPFRVVVPSDAPVLKGDRVADFSPWTGNHPEDILNDHTVKQGHYDRTQVSQNESNTARPSLYAQLKHRSGLQMLSSVFMAALEKRQNHNIVTAPSSFKPPPRVTLTDNKREAWLRDLANPSVPLRRLSRTIPHGIRGKALLDQCLSKWIPVSRAVWLAKCVGANEIRAFKRKGTSGPLAMGLEAKWVREWTSGVQQFLEGVIGACGSEEWKPKMTYAVSLTARLFFERLLDHEQYLNWFLSSFEGASLNLLPVWLLMLGIYWESILWFRQRGRRLAEVLLDKLRHIAELAQPTLLQPLTDRLSYCIRKLVLEHTSSAILPQSWGAYKDLIRSCLDVTKNPDKTTFECLAERNSRVQLPRNRPESTQQSPQQRVIQLFDSIQSSHDISSTSTLCLDALEDRAALVTKLLEWSATPFRFGLRRVYTAARLIRRWKASGVDTDSHIISFLNTDHGTSQLNMDNVYHIISELVRSQTFSISRYLQWLMAKGVMENASANNEMAASSVVCLLTQLPMSRLPEHIRNLRHTLLARAGISISGENSEIEGMKSSISQRLPKIFPGQSGKTLHSNWLQPKPTWAVKSEISMWVRQGVAKHLKDTARKIIGGSFSVDSKVSALTPEEFYAVREVLEDFGDLSILADVIKQATECDDAIVLASAADTISYHFDSLCVIGATSDLFRALIGSYARLKRSSTLSLDLIFSLIELGLRIPEESSTVGFLRQDLARVESKSALAAPSPLSDHIPGGLADVDASFQDKLDQLLSSGNGIDESTMCTIFSSLTKFLGNDNGTGKLSANDACRYLAYLRPYGPKQFDVMLVRYVCGLLKSSSHPTMSHILPPLIGVGCVTIYSFVLLVKKLLAPDKVNQLIPNLDSLRLDLVELLVPQRDVTPDLVAYRFRLAQQEFLLKYPMEALEIINDALPLVHTRNEETDRGARRGDLADGAKALLHTALVQTSSVVVDYCTKKVNGHTSFTTLLEKAVDSLLGFNSEDELEPSLQAEKVILMNNDFSLPFCQLKLQLLFNTEAGNEVRNNIIDVMFKAAVSDSRSERSHWIGLVNLMNQDAVRQVRERAERSFFSVPLFEESPGDSPVPTLSNPGSIESAKLYLTIIEKLAYSIPESGFHSVAPLLVERFDILLQKLIVMQSNSNSVSGNRVVLSSGPVVVSRSNFERSLAFWFSALLRLAVLHRAAFTVPASLGPKTGLQEQTRLLVSIVCISLARLPDNILRLFPTANYFPHSVDSQNFRPCPGVLLQTHALDVAASLIDAFPDEARHQCARFLKEKCPPFLQLQNDRRFFYLIGPITDVILNPQLPASVPSPAAGGSTPTPTPSGNNPGGPSNQTQPMGTFNSLVPALSESVSSPADRLRVQHRGRIMGPYSVRPWELLEDAAPIIGANDTAVSLKLFDTRHARA